MADNLDLDEVDRELLYDRLTELEDADELGQEYEALAWVRDLFYLLDEGFIAATPDGHYYRIEQCPEFL